VLQCGAKGIRSGSRLRTLDHRAWTLPHLRISDPPKSASLFRTLVSSLYSPYAGALSDLFS